MPLPKKKSVSSGPINKIGLPCVIEAGQSVCGQLLNIFYAFLIIFFCTTSGATAEPSQLRFGIYIKSIKLINKDEKADIDFYYWLKFKKTGDQAQAEKFKYIEFVNGEIEQIESVEERDIGDDRYVTGRVRGKFAFVADYTAYPFDKQEAIIEIEHKVMESKDLVIIPDAASYERSHAKAHRFGVADDLRAGDVTVIRAAFASDARIYATDFGDIENEPTAAYSRLTYKVFVQRKWQLYVLKFFMPLVIIISIAYLVFYIPADQLELASSLTVTSILAAIAFQITLVNDTPNVGYLTCVDKIFYLTYVLIMFAMVQTVWTWHLEKSGRATLSSALEICSRFAFPAVFFGGSSFIMWSGLHVP